MFTTRPLWQQLALASIVPGIFASLFAWFYSESPAGLVHLVLFCSSFGYCCGKHFFGDDRKRTFAAARTFIGVFAVFCAVLSFVHFGGIMSFLGRPGWMYQTYSACFGVLYVIALFAAFRIAFSTTKLSPLLLPAIALGPILSYVSDSANHYSHDSVRKNPNMVAHAIIDAWWYAIPGLVLTYYVTRATHRIPLKPVQSCGARPWFLYIGVAGTWLFAALYLYVAAELKKYPCDLCSINLLPYAAGGMLCSAFVIISGVLKFAGNSLAKRDKPLVIGGMLSAIGAMAVAFGA